MAYVDGFVLVVPKKNFAAYRRLARLTGKIWREHGALEYRECVADDLKIPVGVPFDRRLRCKPGETVVLAWIVYRSRAHRDRVNRLSMGDERLLACVGKQMPFDCRRMSFGGFRVFVDR